MPVKERDSMKGGDAPETVGKPGWMARLNEFGERHAKVIITISTALVILTVLVFAKTYHDKARVERAWKALQGASTVEDLEKLNHAYSDTPVAPVILYSLGNKYREDGKLEKARVTYDEFLRNHPHHAFGTRVGLAMDRLKADMAFEKEDKPALLKASLLQTHPTRYSKTDDPRILWGPVPEKPLTVELDAGSGAIRFLLFKDDAPETVARFVELCGKNHFVGMRLARVGEQERMETQPKEDASAETLPHEPTPNQPAEALSLVMIRKEKGGENVDGRFQILLKALPDVTDLTVFGKVSEGAPLVGEIKPDAEIKSLKLVE